MTKSRLIYAALFEYISQVNYVWYQVFELYLDNELYISVTKTTGHH